MNGEPTAAHSKESPVRIIRTVAVAITVAAVAVPAQHAAAAQTATSGVQSVDGAYIVQLHRGADARGLARALQASPRYTYQAALNGFAADLTADQLRALRGNPAVVRIEPAPRTCSGKRTGGRWPSVDGRGGMDPLRRWRGRRRWRRRRRGGLSRI